MSKFDFVKMNDSLLENQRVENRIALVLDNLQESKLISENELSLLRDEFLLLKEDVLNFKENNKNQLEDFEERINQFIENFKNPLDGKDGRDGKDGKNGEDGKNGRDGRNGLDGLNGVNGMNGKDGKDGKDGFNATEVDFEEVKKEVRKIIDETPRPIISGGSVRPITIQDDGVNVDKNVRFINFTGGTITRTNSGVVTVPIGSPATTVTNEITYGISSAVGSSTNYARQDHTHGTMTTPTKTTVGLANVDNTSDANKPVSTATQTALDLKANTADIPILASGVYTPTRSAEANTDSNVTMTQAQYLRVGSVVTVSGRFTADPTTPATLTTFEITLPVASNIGAVEDLAGVAFCGAISGQGAAIFGVIANDTAKFSWVAGDVTSQVWSYTFSYRII